LEKNTKRQTEMQRWTQADLRERARRGFDKRYLIYIKFSATSALIPLVRLHSAENKKFSYSDFVELIV
jgi:hypothetical protein